MLFGFLTERIVVRPLFDAPRVILLVATAGVALLAIAIQIWFFDDQGRPIARAFPTLDRVTVLGVQISDQRLWLIGTLAVLAVVLGAVLHPHQPRPGDHRRQPGADGDRARRDQRAPAVDVHVGRSPRCSAASPRVIAVPDTGQLHAGRR